MIKIAENRKVVISALFPFLINDESTKCYDREEVRDFNKDGTKNGLIKFHVSENCARKWEKNGNSTADFLTVQYLNLIIAVTEDEAKQNDLDEITVFRCIDKFEKTAL